MTFDVTKCKPFDLERALAGDKVVTRGGIEVEQITQFEAIDKFCIYAAVNGSIESFLPTGAYAGDTSNYDLFMAPKIKKFEAWVNVYSWGISCVTYGTEDGAKDGIKDNIEHYIKTIKIETEIEL